jgi:hypothetical protein
MKFGIAQQATRLTASRNVGGARSVKVAGALLLGLLTGLLWVESAAPALATLITLSDKNSVVTINPDSQVGVTGWTVDGGSQLYQQWFWYRIGENGGEAPINTLGNKTSGTYRGTRGAYVGYSGNGLSVEVDYLLTGGGPSSGTADLAESISLENTSASPITVHFFQYSDFDLNGVGAGDMVQFINTNTVSQWKGLLTMAETVNIPAPTHREGGFYPSTLTSLNDGNLTTLSDYPLVGTPLGPGNMTWAYQWDRTIAPGDTFLISKDKHISGAASAPEPSALGLLLAGAIGAAVYVLRRESGSVNRFAA